MILRRAGWISAALGIYLLLGFVLIAQKPGLQYDEALLVSDAVHMAHSPTRFELDAIPKAWICPFHHCVPLMAFAYVGAIKEYANLPLFATVGARESLIRLVALLFGTFTIWGIYRLIDPWCGRWAAAVFAFALAVNPAFLNMVVFDNGANGGFMAALGLTCFSASLYGQRKSAFTAFWLGAAMGFGVWSRANFLWFVLAGVAAAVIVFRRRARIPNAQAIALLAGGLMGGSPFLLYQFVSKWGTWKAQKQASISTPLASLLPRRLFLFADTLLSDGEHRQMWNGPPLPVWQLWLFPGLLVAGCLICLLWKNREQSEQRRFALFLTLTFLFAGGLLFSSHLPVAEHHLVGLVPFAIAIVVLAGAAVQRRFPQSRALLAAVALVYAGSCFYWHIQTARGLKATGGVNVWSNSGPLLATYLDENFGDREIRALDWGFEFNLYVLTDGRIEAQEIFSKVSEDYSSSQRTWTEEIRNGGVFLLHGPENREFPMSSAGFLRALAAARPVITQSRRIPQKDGVTYAQVIDIAPNSFRGASRDLEEVTEVRIPMNTSQVDGQLTGFSYPEPAGFRWTKRNFSAQFDLSHLARPLAGTLALRMVCYIPESTIRKIGPLTLTPKFAGHALAPKVFSQAGQFVLTRDLEDAWIVAGKVKVDFSLDKAVPPSASDGRELGLAVSGISIEPD